MNKKSFIPICIAIVIVIVCILFYKVDGEKTHIGLLEVKSGSDGTNVDNVLLQQKVFNMKDVLPVYASSELSTRFIKAHPAHVFDKEIVGFSTFLCGGGGLQTLPIAIDLAAVKPSENKKMVIILSPQWFESKGISKEAFAKWTSTGKCYEALNNTNLSEETKLKMMTRIDRVTSYQKNFLIKGYVSLNQNFKKLLYPLISIESIKEDLNDINQINRIKQLEVKNFDYHYITQFISVDRKIDFSRLMAEAEEQGKQSVNNNNFGVHDEYYTKYIESNFKTLENSAQGGSYEVSEEYDDLDVLLKVLADMKLDPLFIIVPVNGTWYDYTGFEKNGRIKYYERCESMIKSYGFKVKNFGDYEYEKYFLADIMHMGWKGWVCVDEAIYDFYYGKME